MFFKGTPKLVVTCDGKSVGQFDNDGYLEVKDDVYAARVARKFEKVTITTCKCGKRFDDRGKYMAHCKKCKVYQEAKAAEKTEKKKAKK